jgi:hypothetical protein
LHAPEPPATEACRTINPSAHASIVSSAGIINC